MNQQNTNSGVNPDADTDTNSAFIPFAAGCERLHVSQRVMKNLIRRGLFPAPVRIHRQLRFWRASVFEGALDAYEKSAEQDFQ